MAEKKPKDWKPRNNQKEIGDAASIAAGLFDSRNSQLTGATSAGVAKYLDALKSGRKGEMNDSAQWLRTHAGVLKKANASVQGAANAATAPTALSGALDSSAATALANPTAGNPVLSTMQTQAEQGLHDNGQLTPEEAMNVEQGSRAAYGARGLGTSAPAALSEVLGRVGYVQQRQDRARGYATNTAGLVSHAVDSSRDFGTTVNAQDIGKQGQDYGIKKDAAGFRIATNPSMIAYNTPSMAPTALSAAAGTTAQADVFPQTLNYSAGVNDFNANAEYSLYMQKLNRYYAQKYGGMGAPAGGAGGGGFNTSAAATGALSGLATGAAAGSVVGPWGTVIGGAVGAIAGGLGGGLSNNASVGGAAGSAAGSAASNYGRTWNAPGEYQYYTGTAPKATAV